MDTGQEWFENCLSLMGGSVWMEANDVEYRWVWIRKTRFYLPLSLGPISFNYKLLTLFLWILVSIYWHNKYSFKDSEMLTLFFLSKSSFADCGLWPGSCLVSMELDKWDALLASAIKFIFDLRFVLTDVETEARIRLAGGRRENVEPRFFFLTPKMFSSSASTFTVSVSYDLLQSMCFVIFCNYF